MNKTVTPPSGNKHDFYSNGTYWWPDPAKPDGLPYIRKDGEVNRETQSDKFDDRSMAKMVDAVETLALAYFFSAHEKYASYALELLRAWYDNHGTWYDVQVAIFTLFLREIDSIAQARGEGI